MSMQPPPLPEPELSRGVVPAPGLQELAGFGPRLVARMIDGVISGVAGALIWISFRDSSSSGSLLAFYVTVLGISLLNDVALTAIKGGTVGKLLLGTRVVRVEDWKPVSAGAAGRRWAAMMVLNFIPFLGIVDSLFIFSGTIRQTLHDRFAETVVVRAVA